MYILFVCCLANVIMNLFEYLPQFILSQIVLIRGKIMFCNHWNFNEMLMKFDINSHRQDCIFMHKVFFRINGKNKFRCGSISIKELAKSTWIDKKCISLTQFLMKRRCQKRIAAPGFQIQAKLFHRCSVTFGGPVHRSEGSTAAHQSRDEQLNYRHNCTSHLDHVQTDFWHIRATVTATCQGWVCR